MELLLLLLLVVAVVVAMPEVKDRPLRVSTEHHRWEKPSQWSASVASASPASPPSREFTVRKWQLAASKAFWT